MTKFNTKESLGRLVGIAFIILGAFIAMVGAIWLFCTVVFVSRAAKSPGQVIAMEHSPGSKGGSLYHPVFKFTDSAGIVHTQRASFGSSDYSFEVGETVTILYDPSTPKRSRIESFQTTWLGPLFFTGFGLLFGGFACFWLFVWTCAARFHKR